LEADREQVWCDLAGWRVNHGAALLGLVRLILASNAPWLVGGHRIQGATSIWAR
jgi:hypothetical protein